MEISLQNDLGPFRVNRFGDRYLINVNRERFDRLGAEVVFDQSFGKSLFSRDTFYIIVGTDCGLLPRYVVRKGVPEGSRYLFVELPDVLALIDQVSSERIIYATPDRWLDVAIRLNINDHIFIDKVEVISSCAAEDCFCLEYHETGRVVRHTINRYLWEVRAKLGKEVFIRKQLENLSENRISAKILTGLFKGKTAVLLGGGPSLDDIFPWLLAHRDQVAVIAVSRVSRRLLEVGICPDIVASVDPNPVSFDVSNEMFRFSDTALLVTNYHTCPLILGQWPGRSVYWGNAFPWTTSLNIQTSITMGPTVTNMALDTAVEMGFSQIVLAGVDLCYGRDGRTHARGSFEHEIGANFSESNVQVETFGGWMADTIPAYATAVYIINGQAKKAKERGCRIVNSALSAAKMSNVTYVSLDDLTIDPFERPVSAVLSGVLPEESSSSRSAHYRQVLAELNRADKELRKINKLAFSAIKSNDRLFNRGRSMNFRYKSRLDRIEKKLNEELGVFSGLVKSFGIPSFLKIVKPESDKILSSSELEEIGKTYYESYQNSSERLLKLIEDSVQRVKSRLEEESENPEFRLLIKQWKKDYQPGRVFVFRKWHNDLVENLSFEERKMAELAENQFNNLLDKGYGGVTAKSQVKDEIYDKALSGAFLRVLSAYRKKIPEELERMMRILEGHSSQNAGLLLLLARGYYAELIGEHGDAFDMYQEAFEVGDAHMQEEALRSIAFLALKIDSTDDALLALQLLSERSPVYMPMYAETLKSLGRAEEALDVYASYLDMVPEDYAAMINLGCYYRELGIAEGARLMFSHVLEMVPEHRVARMLLEEMS